MSSSFRAPLALSIAIHVLLGFALIMNSTKHPQPSPPLQIEIVERKPVPSSSAHRGSGKKSASGSRHGLSLSDLAPKAKGGTLGGSLTDSGETGPLAEEWGSSAGQFALVEHLNQYQRLFAEIQGLLYFPPVLGRRGISGTVNSHLVFDQNSHCDWSRTRVQGGDPYLRFYSLAVLKKLCSFTMLQSLRFKAQTIDLSFDFELVESTDQPAPPDQIISNVLSFHRAFAKSALEYNLGPLHGMLFVPAVSLDFVWIAEHWNQYVNGKDPLAEFKQQD
jgi:hypothetical protein